MPRLALDARRRNRAVGALRGAEHGREPIERLMAWVSCSTSSKNRRNASASIPEADPADRADPRLRLDEPASASPSAAPALASDPSAVASAAAACSGRSPADPAPVAGVVGLVQDHEIPRLRRLQHLLLPIRAARQVAGHDDERLLVPCRRARPPFVMAAAARADGYQFSFWPS